MLIDSRVARVPLFLALLQFSCHGGHEAPLPHVPPDLFPSIEQCMKVAGDCTLKCELGKWCPQVAPAATAPPVPPPDCEDGRDPACLGRCKVASDECINRVRDLHTNHVAP
jgi:hypothetical protein